MMANIIDCEPDQISAGMPVAVEFHPISNDFDLPYFAPSASGAQKHTDALLEAGL